MSRLKGFTLLEVLMAVAIFILLAGGIFATIQSALRASAELSEAQLETSRDEAFERFCRHLFLNLPADSRIELHSQRWDPFGDLAVLLIWPAPPGMDLSLPHGDGVVLALVPDGSGNLELAVTGFSSELSPGARERYLQGATWTKLLPKITWVRWRFVSQTDPKYVESWTAENGRPALVELTLGRGAKSEESFQLQVPVVVPFRDSAISPK